MRIDREIGLQAQQGVKAEHTGAAERNHRNRIFEPLLLGPRLDASDTIEPIFDGADDRSEKGPAILKHIRHECADRIGGDEHQRKRQPDFE